MPAKVKPPPEQCEIGAVISFRGRPFEVKRSAMRGMQGTWLILEDVGDPSRMLEVPYDEVKKQATLARRACDSPKVPELGAVPVSLECLIAESRALRAA